MGRRSYGRYSIETSNEDKLLFPEAEVTKGELIDYYERIADRLLPHLEDRPLAVQRFPDGIEEEGFYQKEVRDYFPDWITTVRVDLKSTAGSQELVVCDKRATLAYLADQACVTLHPWLSRRDELDHPDLLVIDLDPAREGFEETRSAALRVRDLLEGLGLACYAKLTGSRGVHVVAPLDRSSGFDAVRDFAREATGLLAARHPDELTIAQSKSKRRGRVYLDTGRNAYGQTAVASWSVRALPEAPVAAPVAWRDLERKGIGPRDYTVKNVFRRVARRQDPWADLRRRARSLGPARERLQRLREDEGP